MTYGALGVSLEDVVRVVHDNSCGWLGKAGKSLYRGLYNAIK